jgi:hypothetical protein
MRAGDLQIFVLAKNKPQVPAKAAWPSATAYAVRMVSVLSPEIAACAAAKRAMGTR